LGVDLYTGLTNTQVDVVHAVFKSESTLRSYLVWPKDPAHPTKQDGVVNRTTSCLYKQDWKTGDLSGFLGIGSSDGGVGAC